MAKPSLPLFRVAIVAWLAFATACSPSAPTGSAPAVDFDLAREQLHNDVAFLALQVDAAAQGDAAALAAMRERHAQMQARVKLFEDPRSDYLQEVAPDRGRKRELNLLRSAEVNLGGHIDALEKLAPELRGQREAYASARQELETALTRTDFARERLVEKGGAPAQVLEMQDQKSLLERIRHYLRKVVDNDDAENAANTVKRDFVRWRENLAQQRAGAVGAALGGLAAQELGPLDESADTLGPLLEGIVMNPRLTRDARYEAAWTHRIYNAYPQAPGRDTPPKFD